MDTTIDSELARIDKQTDDILKQGNGVIHINNWLRTELAETRLRHLDDVETLRNDIDVLSNELTQTQVVLTEVCLCMDTVEKALNDEELSDNEFNLPLVDRVVELSLALDLAEADLQVARRLNDNLFLNNRNLYEALAVTEIELEQAAA